MAVRGSAIGASMGSSVFGGAVTGRAASPSTKTTYPGGIPSSSNSSSKGWAGATLWLLVLVLLEAAALLAMRHGFRHHHGG